MPIDDLTALGQKMREARKKKDLTQQELADLSHVSVKQIASIEKGQINPSYLILKALAKVLPLSLDTLINPDVSPEDEGRYSLITNYSILAPESTRPFVMPEDDRYEKASKMLNIYGNHFTVNNAFSILQAVCQEGIWATRVSFVYSAEENAVYYVQNNNFSQIGKYEF